MPTYLGGIQVRVETIIDQIIQWGTQSSEGVVILIVAGVVTLLIGLAVGIHLGRWVLRRGVNLGVWLIMIPRDIVGDTIRRWRAPQRDEGDGDVGDGGNAGSDVTASRDYLRIRPTSAEYDPETLVTALEGLHRQHKRTELSLPWRRGSDDTIELIAATEGPDDGVEFYVGGDISLHRLASALPYQQCGFDVDRVKWHPATLLTSATTDPGSTPVTDSATSIGDETATSSSSESAASSEALADGAGATAGTDLSEERLIDDREAEAEFTVDSEDKSTACGDGPRGEDAALYDIDLMEAKLAQLTDQGREPVVYRLNTCGRRRKDWMTQLPRLTELVDVPADAASSSGTVQSGSPPLTPMIETLGELAVPAFYQVTFRPFRTWDRQADRRRDRLEHHEDSLGQRLSNWVVNAIFASDLYESDKTHANSRSSTYRDTHSNRRSDRSRRRHRSRHSRRSHHSRRETMAQSNRERYDDLEDNDMRTTYVANIRIGALPTEEHSRDEVAATLRRLWDDLDQLDGDFYHLADPPSSVWERVAGLVGIRGVRHRQRLRRLCRRQIVTPVLGHTRHNRRKRWPDLVCNPDELAAWVAIPSTAALPDAVTEHLPHRPAHTDPQRTLTPALQQEYVGPDVAGVRVADLLTDDRQADPSRPVALSGRDLYRHVLTLGMTGVGKTTDQAQRAAAAVDATRGPVIVVTGPGANVGRYTMRALAARNGIDWVREHVHWFPFPAVMPGLTVLDVEDMADQHPDLVDRWDAVEQVRDYLIEILRQVLGPDDFKGAPRSIQLVQELIMAAFDPEYWYENTADPRRSSPDRCRFSHLTTELAELAEAGPPSGNPQRRPRSSRPDYDTGLAELLNADPETFHNVINGAHTRLNAIANYDQRLMLFDNTESRFSFADILDSDDVYIFDLSTLETEPQQLMTLVLVMQLYDELRANQDQLQSRPDDYMVNLVVDEAAHLIGFEYLSTLLAQGRNHRLAMDLATQFAEQIEEQADREAFLNLLNNTGTKLLATHNLDEEIAKHLLPEGMTVEELRQQVRDLPEAHRLLLLPPQPDEERPQALTVHRGSLPAWHPDASATPFDEDAFATTLDTVRERTAEEYGLPEEVREGVRSGWERPAVPPMVQETLGLLRETDIDAALALMTAHVQEAENTRETNDWVGGESVIDRFMTWIDHARDNDATDTSNEDAGEDTFPDADGLLEDVRDSPYLDCQAAAAVPTIEQDEGLVIQLTDDGEEMVTELEATGEAVTAGSDDHDSRLAQTKTALIRAGFEVTLLDQDTSAKADGQAVHPAVEWPLVLEYEGTTRTRPDKVLTNLQRAQEQGAVPIFIVEAAEDGSDHDATHPAEVLAGILSSPVNMVTERDAGVETVFYNHTNTRITFNGGATEGGETAVRPTTGADDSRRSVWVQTPDGEYALRDSAGDEYTEYLRVSELEELSRADVPAYYTYNDQTETRTVHEGGDTYTYASKDAFQAEWVTIKRPFIPSKDLPVPDYGRDTYAILLVRDEPAEDEEAVVVYDDEAEKCKPLSTLSTALRDGDLQPATDARDAPVTDEDDVDAADLTAKQLSVKEFASLLQENDSEHIAEVGSEERPPADIETALESTDVFAVYRLVQAYRERPSYAQPAHFASELNDERQFTSKRIRDSAAPGTRTTYWLGLSWQPPIEPVVTRLLDALEDVSDDTADFDPERALEDERVKTYVDLLVETITS